ncbi:Uncharacterised protein [Segatella copri]|nr:Uncharacterised protein [Segatella copri]
MSEIAFNGSLKLVVSNAVTTPKPTKPTPTKSPDFRAFPNFMPIHRPMTVKMIGIITLAPRLII